MNELVGADRHDVDFPSLAIGLTAVHVVFGLAGVSMARVDISAHTFLVDWGTAYLALWSCAVVVGMVMVVVGLSGWDPNGASPCDRGQSG